MLPIIQQQDKSGSVSQSVPDNIDQKALNIVAPQGSDNLLELHETPYDLMLDDELYGVFESGDDGSSNDFSFSDAVLEYLNDTSMGRQEISQESKEPNHQLSDPIPNIPTTTSSLSDTNYQQQNQLEPTAHEKTSALNSMENQLTIDGQEGTLPWHSNEVDRQHRLSMIQLIFNLLKARKKDVPSNEWLKQLPHKAKKLERRLYHSAPSLEAYIDRTTIKVRLQALARAIAVQHRDSRIIEHVSAQLPPSGNHINRLSYRNSTISQSTIDSSTVASRVHRNSVLSTTSIDSLADLRESVDTKVVFNPDQLRDNDIRTERGSSFTSKRSTDDTNEIPEKKRRGSAESFEIPLSRQITNSIGEEHKKTLPIRNAIAAATSEKVSELERQKAVNERLQQEIMEHIRLQEELVKKLQASQSSGLLQQQQLQQQQQRQQQPYFQQNEMNRNLGPLQHNLNIPMQQSTINTGVPIPIQNQVPQLGTNPFALQLGSVQQLPQQQQQQQNGQNVTSNNLYQAAALRNQLYLQQQASSASFGNQQLHFHHQQQQQQQQSLQQQSQFGRFPQHQQVPPATSSYDSSMKIMELFGNNNHNKNNIVPPGVGLQGVTDPSNQRQQPTIVNNHSQLSTSTDQPIQFLRDPIPLPNSSSIQQPLSSQQQMNFPMMNNSVLSLNSSSLLPQSSVMDLNVPQQSPHDVLPLSSDSLDWMTSNTNTK